MSVALDYLRGPLTVAQFAALPEDTDAKLELQEGNVVVSPRPTFGHQQFVGNLYAALQPQTPAHLSVAPDVDVDLGIVPPARPGFVRAPDLVVTTAQAKSRVRAEGGFLRAAEVLLAVEVFSPGSRRTDSVVKLGEYLEAAIPNYWLIDLDGGPSLQAFRISSADYVALGSFTGTVSLELPFPLQLDLDDLAR